MELRQIINKDGMACKYSYVVYDRRESYLLAVDLIGADAAVKAVWATLAQNKWVDIDAAYRRVRIPKELQTATIRTTLAQEPLLCRWHVVPRPDPGDLALTVYGWEAIQSPADALIGALARWTIWPTQAEWAETLYRLGERHRLIKRLDGTGVDYAFVVRTVGWDKIIDGAVKDGQLSLPA